MRILKVIRGWVATEYRGGAVIEEREAGKLSDSKGTSITEWLKEFQGEKVKLTVERIP